MFDRPPVDVRVLGPSSLSRRDGVCVRRQYDDGQRPTAYEFDVRGKVGSDDDVLDHGDVARSGIPVSDHRRQLVAQS